MMVLIAIAKKIKVTIPHDFHVGKKHNAVHSLGVINPSKSQKNFAHHMNWGNDNEKHLESF